MNFAHIIKNYFVKSFDFTGRASRIEFWLIWLLEAILFIPILALLDNTRDEFIFVGCVIFIFLLIANFSLTIRRLHDTNRSGAWILLTFVPFGLLILLIFYLSKGDINSNNYGDASH